MAGHDDGLISLRDVMLSSGIKPLSKVQNRLVESSIAIRSGAPDEIAFQHTVLCQTGLPYKATDQRRWEARNGRVMLEVEAGRAYHPIEQAWMDLPLPFGPKARLILMYLNSEAVKRQSRVIEVEESMTAFIKALQGREPNGDEVRKFKTQMAALAAATIRLAVANDTPEAVQSINAKLDIVENFDLWFSKDARQKVLWSSTVELSEKYFNTLLHHAVPLNPIAIAALAHSAVSLDIYTWLAQRLCRIPTGKTQLVPWPALYAQFGHGYKLLRQFRAEFIKALNVVKTQYPAACVAHDDQGLHLRASDPPVPRITGSY